MEALLTDIRYDVRGLRKAPLFAAGVAHFVMTTRHPFGACSSFLSTKNSICSRFIRQCSACRAHERLEGDRPDTLAFSRMLKKCRRQGKREKAEGRTCVFRRN